MTRTDVMASSRPRTAGTATRKGSTSTLRRLALLPVVLLALAFVGPATALAAESGYSQEPNKPSTGTSPSKETSSPKTSTNETAPSKAATTPTTEAAKTSTLPFTGFDLRWSVGAGLLLMGAGFSIVAVQRRRREN